MFLGEHTHAQAHKIISDSTLSGSNIPPSSSHSNNNNNNNNNNNKTTVPATVSTSAGSPTKKNVPNAVGHLSGGVNSHDGGLFSLSYFYPVLPIEYIIPPPVTTTSMMMMTAGDGDGVTTGSSSTGTGAGANGVTTGVVATGSSSSSGGGGVGNSGTVVEAIIGNDVQDVLLVPREVEPPRGMSRWKGVGLRRQDVAALQQQQQPPPLSSSQSSSEYRPLFVLQGNFGGKHAHRRDPKGRYDNDCNTAMHPRVLLHFSPVLCMYDSDCNIYTRVLDFSPVLCMYICIYVCMYVVTDLMIYLLQ